MIGSAAMVMFDQREFNLSGFVGFGNGPISAANVGRAILNHSEKQAEGEYRESESSAQSHKILLWMSLKIGRRIEDSHLLEVD
jgi:hypothetical protein